MARIAPSSVKLPNNTVEPGKACEINEDLTHCEYCLKSMKLGLKMVYCPSRSRQRNIRSVGLMVGSMQP